MKQKIALWGRIYELFSGFIDGIRKFWVDLMKVPVPAESGKKLEIRELGF